MYIRTPDWKWKSDHKGACCIHATYRFTKILRDGLILLVCCLYGCGDVQLLAIGDLWSQTTNLHDDKIYKSQRFTCFSLDGAHCDL